jgi:hypothetical protein
VSAEGTRWPSDQAISRLAIVKAIRPGSKRARSQRSYLRAVVADPVIASLRDALRERRGAASRSAPEPEPAPVIPPDPVAARKAARDKAFRARQHKL